MNTPPPPKLKPRGYLMKKFFILLLLLSLTVTADAQFLKKFFQWSTIYTAGSIGQPLQEPSKEWYVAQNGELKDITEIYPFDYRFSIGIRKLARFDYENRQNIFYDGTETNVGGKSNVGAVEGVEYVFSKDWVRQWGDEYTNQSYFLRYLGKYWIGKVQFLEVGVADLKYASAEVRGRLSIGKFLNFSLGTMVRTHGPYGYNPISIYLADNYWWDLAYEYGYTDQYYQITDVSTGNTTSDWMWEDPEGEHIASTDEEFRRYYYADIVNDFNNQKLSEVGGLATISAVAGLDIYYYSDKFWCHAWGNILPFHKHILGDENFSYGEFISRDPEGNGSNQWIDYNVGTIMGVKVGKGFGVFIEGEYLQYWDRIMYSSKVGINYQFK